MRYNTCTSIVALAASTLLAANAMTLAQNAPRYAIINVGDIGGVGIATGRAISNRGDVVGVSLNGAVGELQAYVWREGVSSYLPSLYNDFETYPYDINDEGNIVGRAYNAQRDDHAVLWPSSGGVTDLGTLGGSESIAYGIDSNGRVVGGSDLLPSGSNPFLWVDGEMAALGDFGTPGGEAYATNDVGQIVGYAAGSSEGGAFLWENGQLTNLGALVSGRRTFARDINNSGMIVGYADVLDYTQRAVIWRDGAITNIHDDRLGLESFAYAVNDRGQAVGGLVVDNFPLEFGAFLYEGNGPMVNLDTMLPPHLNWSRIESASDINDHGEIVGRGNRSNGHGAAYLLAPVHPTLTLQGPQPGRAGTLNGMRVTGCTPGARVHFYYSTHGGGTLVPGCNHTDGVTLQLENPIRAGSATANANGVATLTRFIPGNARNLGDILIQAIDADNCRITQLVVHQFN